MCNERFVCSLVQCFCQKCAMVLTRYNCERHEYWSWTEGGEGEIQLASHLLCDASKDCRIRCFLGRTWILIALELSRVEVV